MNSLAQIELVRLPDVALQCVALPPAWTGLTRRGGAQSQIGAGLYVATSDGLLVEGSAHEQITVSI